MINRKWKSYHRVEFQVVKLFIYFVWREKWPEVGMYMVNDFFGLLESGRSEIER